MTLQRPFSSFGGYYSASRGLQALCMPLLIKKATEIPDVVTRDLDQAPVQGSLFPSCPERPAQSPGLKCSLKATCRPSPGQGEAHVLGTARRPLGLSCTRSLCPLG